MAPVSRSISSRLTPGKSALISVHSLPSETPWQAVLSSTASGRPSDRSIRVTRTRRSHGPSGLLPRMIDPSGILSRRLIPMTALPSAQPIDASVSR